MAEKRCIPLTGVSDGPYMLEPPGTLTALQNMRLRPGGYAEARGGMEKLKPSGGTSAEPVTSGGTSAGIQVSTSNGWLRGFASSGSIWSVNQQFNPGYYKPFANGDVDDAFYEGSDAPFGRSGYKMQVAANWNVTLVREYWDGAAWSALTMQETFGWTTIDTTSAVDGYDSWQIPSNWAATVIGNTTTGNILKYWKRTRISAKVAVTTVPRLSSAFMQSIGMRELYVLSQQPYTAGPNGKLMRYDQSAAGGTAQYFAVDSAMYSSPESIPSVAAYSGRVFMTNPKETKKWDGNAFQDVGNARPTAPGSSRQAGAGLGAGIWRYYVAFGYGPLGNDPPFTTNGYLAPTFGISRATLVVPTANADPNDANSIVTTAGNERVRIDWSALSVSSSVSCIIIYRTQDLTNVNVAQRDAVPAYPWVNLDRFYLITTTTWDDTGGAFIDGAAQAVLYDNLPPRGSRYCFIFENRLVLGGGPGSGWYYSDPFFPDQFNNTFQFLQFVRAQGGRDMGGVEFGGWGVFFTEDQTWGAQNLDADVPYLIPIHSGVGCVAPNSIAVGDGWLIWAARDGIYAWDGSRAGPKNVSGKFKHTFASLNFEAHGGSRAVIHNHKYDLTFVDAKNGQIGTAFTLNLENFEWATRTTNDKKIPLCLIHAPLGHADAGVPHALYAKATIGTSSASDATSYSPCVADYTTQDDGTNYTCLATAHFPLPPGGTFSPKRVLAYYDALDGWVTPALSVAASNIGEGDVGTITTGGPDTGTDYSIIAGTYSLQSSGTSDLKVTLSASSAAGGAVYGQRFFGMVLEGEEGEFRQGGL